MFHYVPSHDTTEQTSDRHSKVPIMYDLYHVLKIILDLFLYQVLWETKILNPLVNSCYGSSSFTNRNEFAKAMAIF